MEAGLSSGKDSEDDETTHEGFREEMDSSIGWTDAENANTITPIRDIHSYFVQRSIKKQQVTASKLFEKGYAANKVTSISLKVVKIISHYYQSSSTTITV